MRSRLPKVLHPLAGKPLLTHVLDTARALTPTKLIVIVGHSAETVQQATAAPDVEFVLQQQQLGTGHAVQQALPLLDPNVPTLVLYGDVPLIRASTLTRLIQACEANNAYGILTAYVPNPTGYGRIVRDKAMNVVKIVEQKDANETERAIHEINTGIVALPTARLEGWLAALKNNNAKHEYYLTDVVEQAHLEGAEIVTTEPEDFWETLGINDQAQLAQLERIKQQQIATELMVQGVRIADPARFDVRGEVSCGTEVSIDLNCLFEGHVKLADGVQIGPNCVLKNTTIAAGATIHAFTHIENAQIGAQAVIGPYARIRPGTVLAEQTRVGNFVEIKQARLGAGTKVNHLAYIGDAEIGKQVNLGAGVITCNYDGAHKHRTIIEDNAFVGSDTQLVAPVRIGEHATIAAGTTVWKDAPAHALVLNQKNQVAQADYLRPSKTQSKGDIE